jgi:hypothetical protein
VKYEINPKTGLPAIVCFRETWDNQLVVFTFCERHPQNSDDWDRKGPCAPMYFLVLEGNVYTFQDCKLMWKVAEEVSLMTADDLRTTLMAREIPRVA